MLGGEHAAEERGGGAPVTTCPEGRRGRLEEEFSPPPLTNCLGTCPGARLLFSAQAAEAGQGRPHVQTLCVREPPKGGGSVRSLPCR